MEINLLALVRQLMPIQIRQPLTKALVEVGIAPIRKLYSNLLSYRDRTTYRLSFNPQVCSLERLLNDRYDNISRRITITDGIQVNETYLYLFVEEQPLYIFLNSENTPKNIYLSDEPGNVDFVVNYPAEVNLYQAEATVLIDKNKLASKTFNYNIT